MKENERLRVVDILADHLIAEGSTTVFGIPGGLLHPLVVDIDRRDDIDLVVTKHEEGSAFMADGYARASGKIGVCIGTSGPGTTNLMTGVGVAYSDGIPMLVITGQAPFANLGRGAVQETSRQGIDVVAMLAPITKYSAMVSSPESFARHLRRALRLAMTGRRGPVHLNIPVDFWMKEVVRDTIPARPDAYRPESRLFDRGSVIQAAELLARAERPVILAGSGVRLSGAKSELERFADQIGARVVTTPAAKGVFPEDHPGALGVLGFAGHRCARELVMGDVPDVLLSVGASLNETTTFNWDPALLPNEALIQVDIDVDRIARNYPVDVALVGDARAILDELYFHVRRKLDGGPSGSRWPEDGPTPAFEERLSEPELRASSRSPLTPQRWRADLQRALPDDALVFSDVGGHMLFNIHELCIGREQDFILNLGFGSMGHGTVAPIGAAIASPDRPIVAIIGDACFTMNGMELIAAVEYDVPVVWIVENNQMHGITWHGSQTVGDKKPLDAIVYKKELKIFHMARAMGLTAWRVNEPGQLTDVMNEALSLKRPCLIEVIVDPSVSPPLSERAATVALGDADERAINEGGERPVDVTTVGGFQCK